MTDNHGHSLGDGQAFRTELHFPPRGWEEWMRFHKHEWKCEVASESTQLYTHLADIKAPLINKHQQIIKLVHV